MSVLDPSGHTLSIPAWMLSADAAHYSVMEEAQISVRALLEIAYLVGACPQQSEESSSSSRDRLSPPGSGPGKEVKHEAARLGVPA